MNQNRKSALENIKSLFKSQEAVIKLFNDYSSIAPEAKCKKIHKKIISSMAGGVACDKVCDHSNLKILGPKQTLQRLPIAFVQEKADNTSENLANEIKQIIYALYQAKEIIKTIYNSTMN